MNWNLNRQTVERSTAIAAGLAAIALYVVAYPLPMWTFTLHAPQYPEGLDLILHLSHLEGDIQEINGLNHYIGMGKLQEAAQLERAYAHWGVGLVCALVAGGILYARGRIRWYVLAPALAFPVVFCADQYYWLYRFGHNLDPRAPIEIPPFTPTMFGRGQIGQFETTAGPTTGFWLLVAAFGVLAIAWLIPRLLFWKSSETESDASTPESSEAAEPSGSAQDGSDAAVAGAAQSRRLEGAG